MYDSIVLYWPFTLIRAYVTTNGIDKKSGTHLIMLITIRENKMLMKAM